MLKKIPALFILMFFSQIVSADVAEQILKSAWTDKSVKLVKEQSEYLESPGVSFIRQGQIYYAQDSKSKANELTVKKIGLRLYPVSLAEINTQIKQKNEKRISSVDIQLSKALLERYELIINYVETSKKIELLTQVTEVAGKNFRSQILASKIGKPDARKIIKARISWTHLQHDLNEAMILKEQLSNQIMNYQHVDLAELKDTKNWIIPAEILKKAKKFSKELIPLSAQLKQYEANDINSEQALFYGRRRSIIDYLELNYGQTEDNSIKDTSVGFKVSFNLPFFEADEGAAINNRSRVQKSVSIEKNIIDLRSQYQNSIQRLTELIGTYSELNGFYNNSDLYKKSLSFDPQTDIEALLESLIARVEFMDLEKEIRLSYIKLIFENGQIMSSPDANYLLSDKSRI